MGKEYIRYHGLRFGGIGTENGPCKERLRSTPAEHETKATKVAYSTYAYMSVGRKRNGDIATPVKCDITRLWDSAEQVRTIFFLNRPWRR